MAGVLPRYKPNDTVTKIANISTATTTELVAAQGAAKKIQVIALSLVSKEANVTTLKSATTAISPAWDWAAAGGGIGLQPYDDSWMETAANEALNITTTTTGPVQVLLKYRVGTV